MTFQIKKAERQQVKLKIAVQGPSGSGKTLGALGLAFSLSPSGKVCLIDTEHESSALYADRYGFDILPLAPPYTSARYQEALKAAADAGYEVIVVDSITHQWDGEGGILDRKAELDKRPGSNSYTNWQSFTPEHTRFLETILKTPAHIIATMRSKSEYVLTTNDKGKQQPKKMGMAPIQREGVEFEFTVVFDVQLDHKATAVKDRTDLYGDRVIDLLAPEVGKQLMEWMGKGSAPAAVLHNPRDFAPENIVEGVMESISANDKGTWYKVGNEVLTTKAADIIKKLDGSETRKVKIGCHSDRINGKVRVIVNVLEVEPPSELEDTLKQSVVAAENNSKIDAAELFSDEFLNENTVPPTAKGIVKNVRKPVGKGPLSVEIASANGTIASLSTFSKTDQKRLEESNGQAVILRYTRSADQKYMNIAAVERVGQVDFTEGA